MTCIGGPSKGLLSIRWLAGAWMIVAAAIAAADTIPVFADVPYNDPTRSAIERIYRAGVTNGCGANPRQYCPASATTRAQIATLLGRAVHGPAFVPNAGRLPNPFSDVPNTHALLDWMIQGHAIDAIVGACGASPLSFCPDAAATRDTMAQYLLLSKFYPGTYSPPAATGAIFADVPATLYLANWIEALYNQGITNGCYSGPLRYCPSAALTRAQAATFITRALKLVPSVEITQVTLQGTSTTTLSIQATATANDSLKAISSIKYYSGSTLICTVTNPPAATSNCLYTPPASGTYQLTAVALDQDGGSRTSAPVSVSVPNAATPSVALTAPAAGAVFAAPANVAVSATASDAGGAIARVDFVVAPDVIATSTSAPYNGMLPNVPPGNYTLVARAIDDQGLIRASNGVSFAVCAPPAVTLTSPAAGQTFTAPAALALKASVTVASGCGPVQKVEYYDGATLLGTSMTGPSYPVSATVYAGSRSLTARAYDARTSTTSTAVVINVASAPPSIVAVQTSGNNFVLGSPVVFDVSAADADSSGQLNLVLRHNGNPVGTVTPIPGTNSFRASWTPTLAGTHSLTLEVIDPSGLKATQVVAVTAVAPPVTAAPNPDAVIPTGYTTPAIGTLPGSFAVGDSGAATYTVPIAVPPGAAGLQPSLSLVYNSQASQGLLGVGWSLSGLSTITRCPATIGQDGVRASINYDNDRDNDFYCLDGQRLVRIGARVAVSDTNYSDNAPTPAYKSEYRTEAESYVRVESYEEQWPAGYQRTLAGPYRFRVWTKAGQILDFGSRFWIVSKGWDQRWPANGSNQPRVNVAKVWVLDRVTDRSGNLMEIDYADRALVAGPGHPDYNRNVVHFASKYCSNATTSAAPPTPIGAYPNVEYWPTRVRYASRNALTTDCGTLPYQEVRFAYEDVPGQEPLATRDRYYDPGAGQSTLSKRLTGIETRVSASQQAVTQYRLSYAASSQTGRSLLKSVQQCSGIDGVCLPPTQFRWAEADWSSGKTFAVTSIGNLPFTIDRYGHKDNGVYVADWNGDGRSDLIGWRHTWQEGSGGFLHELFVCLSSGSGFNCGAAPIFSYSDQYGTVDNADSVRFNLLDFDNDGRADFAYSESNSLSWTFCRSNGDTTCTMVGPFQTSSPLQRGYPSFRGDVDGDGRIDIINYRGNAVYEVCLTRQNGFDCSTQNLAYPPYPYTPCPATDTHCEDFFEQDVQFEVLVADANGDGKADLIRRRSSQYNESRWKVCLSDFGPGRPNQFLCHDRFIQATDIRANNTVLFDFNGDGLADMASSEAGNQWRVCLQTGDGAFEFRDPDIHWDGTQYVDGKGVPIDYYDSAKTPRCRMWAATGASGNEKAIYGDFNGDGRTDIASWVGGGSWMVCLSTSSAFSCSTWSGPAVTGTSNPDLNQWVVTGDFDGDGKTDMVLFYGVGSANLGRSTGPGSGDLLTLITTGLGANTLIVYAPLTNSQVYAKGSGATASASELDIQSPLHVVSVTSASDGNGGWFASAYFYEGLRGRTDGRGLYGFEKKRVRDGNGIVTETVYQRVPATSYGGNWPIVGRPQIVRKYAPTPASFVADVSLVSYYTGANSLFNGQLTLVNRLTNTWATRTSSTCGAPCAGSPAVREALLTQTVEEAFELDGSALPSTTTSTLFDPFGNPQSVTVATSDGYRKATNNVYDNDVGNWVLWRVTSAAVTMTKPDNSASTRKSSFAYHGLNGVSCGPAAPYAPGYICEETIEPDLVNDVASSYSLWQKTSHQYDDFGNRWKTTLSFKERDGTPRARSTTTGYSTDGRFPLTITNALGHKETREYDTTFGTLKRQIDANGIATDRSFDGLGRVYGERVTNASGQRIAETFTTLEAAKSGVERYRVRKLTSGSGETRTYFDELQRSVRVETRGFGTNGAYAQATTAYDALGRRARTAVPAGGDNVVTTITYDVLNRPSTETRVGTGMSLTTDYAYTVVGSIAVDGKSVDRAKAMAATQRGTGLATRTTTRFSNSQGHTVRVTDGLGANTDYVYDPYGNLAKTSGPAGIAETLSYDLRGRKVSMASPDSGTWSYQYNGAGELVRQTDAKGQVTLQFYDALGRVIERREHAGDESTVPFVTVSSFDAYAGGPACNFGIGKLCETRTATTSRSAVGGALPSSQTRRSAIYDAAGRTWQSTLEIDGRAFQTVTAYDANGRIDRLMYPSGYTVQSSYDSWSGQLKTIAEYSTVGTVHWQATARFADGQIDAMTVGGLATSKTYDGFGRVRTIRTGSGGAIQNATYAFDALGNLTSRVDASVGQATQTFGYDAVNRLTTDGLGSVIYQADGNIASRPGGSYTYVGGTHRVQTAAGYTYYYDNNGNVQTIVGGAGTRSLGYTPFNLPISISGPGGTLAYVYDGSHARVREVSTTAAGTEVTYYAGGYETHLRKDNVQEQRHYLATPEGIVGIHTLRSNGAEEARYWHKDHLGGLVAVTDSTGTVKQGFAYDAWGNRSQRVLATGEPYAEERGYTGHEHLVEVGLIHMNGRIYDPVTARFLQADPVIQDPWNGQSLNRYAYVLNNPLSYTDPSGFSWWTKWRRPIIAVLATVATYGATSWMLTSAAVEAGTSTAFATTTLSEFGVEGATLTTAGQAVAGAEAGFAAGGIQGGNVESAVYGAFTGGVMGAIGGLVGEYSLPVRIGTKAATSAALAYVQGGDWRKAARFAMFAELGQAGWAYARDQTDTLYSAFCGREGNCSYDEFGRSTDGARDIVRSISPEEMERVPGPLTTFLESGMSMEGQPHMYTPGRPFCYAIGDALCGAVRGFVRQVSKPHDWGNSWSYDRDPSSLTYGYRLEGGGFNSLSARVAYEIGLQAWSLSTMPVMAGYTAFSLYGHYVNPSLYGARRPH